MQLDVQIMPGLFPSDRGEVEDQLVERLGGEVDILGGGTLMGDPLVSDFSLELGEREAEAVLALCRTFFAELGFALSTSVVLTLGEHEETLTVGGEG